MESFGDVQGSQLVDTQEMYKNKLNVKRELI